MATPAWQISVGGAAVGGTFNDRLLDILLTLHDGHENDSLKMSFDDRDFSLANPGTGQTVTLSLGYLETGLVFMGEFKIDVVRVHGFPETMVIEAKGADQKAAQKQHRTLHYEKKTLGDIVKAAAGRYGLTPFISPELASIQYPYLNQSEESDWHLMTRLSKTHDALFSVKNGVWAFIKRGDSTSLGGLQMPQIAISRFDLLMYEASIHDRAKHKKGRAGWHDKSKGRVKIEESDSSGNGDANFMVRHLLPSQNLAKEAAKSKQAELKRAEGEVEVEIIGNASVQPEGTMIVATGRSVLDGEWLIKTVTHSVTREGFRTKIHGETPKGEGGQGGGSGSGGGG